MSLDLLGLAGGAPTGAAALRVPGAALPAGLEAEGESAGFAGILAEVEAAGSPGVAILPVKVDGAPAADAVPAVPSDGAGEDAVPAGQVAVPMPTSPVQGQGAEKVKAPAAERKIPVELPSASSMSEDDVSAAAEETGDAQTLPETAETPVSADSLPLSPMQPPLIAAPVESPAPPPAAVETASEPEEGVAVGRHVRSAPSAPVSRPVPEQAVTAAQAGAEVSASAVPAAKAAPDGARQSSKAKDAAINPQPSTNAAKEPAPAPEEAGPEAALPVRPGEATSLLDMARSVLPQRGRGGSFSTVETGQGTVVPTTGAVSVRLAGEGMTAPEQAPVIPNPTIATSTTAARQEENPAPVSVTMPDAEAAEGGQSALAAAKTAVPAASHTPSSSPSPAPAEQAPKQAPEQAPEQAMPRDAVRAETAPRPAPAKAEGKARAAEQAEPAAGTTSASSSTAQQQPSAFDMKTFGMAPPVAAATTPLGLTGLAGGIGASLDQKVIDMGVSGQWIDDIARQIATISDNPGRGSFQIASPNLGAVRVDIMPGADGSDIRLTAETEAAQVALIRDKGRLVQDAHLAAIRIGEVRIDRVTQAGESQRGESGREKQPDGGNAQTGTAPNGGQGGHAGTRQDGAAAFAGQYSGGNAKNPFTRTVINDAGMTEAQAVPGESRVDRARYA